MVKFGKLLQEDIDKYHEWVPSDKYLDYERLKDIIYDRIEDFPAEVDMELQKMHAHIIDSTETYSTLCKCSCAGMGPQLVVNMPKQLNPEMFEALHNFIQVNTTGFRKICKKYDKNIQDLVYDQDSNGAKPISEPFLRTVEMLLQVPRTKLSMLVDEYMPVGAVQQGKHHLALWVLLVVSFIAVFTLVLRYAVRPDRELTLFIVGLLASFLLAFANGANDIANSVGTSVGAGALTLTQALVLGSIAEFLGAVTLGSFVSKTISKGVIEPESYEDTPDLFSLAMFAVLWGAGATTLLATMFGLPISATHGVIGGLVAVGLAAKGPDSLGWGKLGYTCIGWVASPIVGGVVSMLVYVVIKKTVHDHPEPARRANKVQPLFTWATLGVLLLFLLMKGPEVIQVKPLWLAVIVSVCGGGTLTLLSYAVLHLRNRFCKDLFNDPEIDTVECYETKGDQGVSIEITDEATNPASWAEHQRLPQPEQEQLDDLPAPATAGAAESPVSTPDGEACNNPACIGTAPSNIVKVMPMSSDDEGPNEAAAKAGAEVEDDPLVEQPFVSLLIISALTVAFAHGANDVGNAVGPLVIIFQIYEQGVIDASPSIPFWSLLMGATGFVLGIVTIGSRTIKTVGSSLTKLSPSRSYATQIGAAVAVLLSSVLGLPVSTSHCLIGSVVGVGIGQQCMGTDGGLDASMLKRIIITWVVTIPAAMLVAYIVFAPLQTFFD